MGRHGPNASGNRRSRDNEPFQLKGPDLAQPGAGKEEEKEEKSLAAPTRVGTIHKKTPFSPLGGRRGIKNWTLSHGPMPPHGDDGFIAGWVRSPGSRPSDLPSRGFPQWPYRANVPRNLGPLTVAGPRRFLTGFRDDPPAYHDVQTVSRLSPSVSNIGTLIHWSPSSFVRAMRASRRVFPCLKRLSSSLPSSTNGGTGTGRWLASMATKVR